MISVKNIYKNFGKVKVLNGVSCDIKKGEKIVIRIMDYSMSLKGLESLCFNDINYKKILKMISEPNGIILVTGATGSGKSTTVYSLLQRLNTADANLITVEDPVEMELEGINQVQVNSEIGLNFAAVLRSILRQDPNIIMIGEIRDSETAQIAVRASITGHLVLSTIHTNNSLSTIERLLDMDVERYLLASALEGIISQKLARKLCDKCKKVHKTTPYEKEMFKRCLGMEVEEVSVDRALLNASYSVYVTIHSAEASSNMSNLTGFIFGPRGEGNNYIEMMKDHRTKGFSPLIKRRFIIGSYVLQKENKEKYFNNAQRVRRLLVDTWKDLFKKYDAVLSPVGIGPAKKIDELNKQYDTETIALDEQLQIGNFGGFPSISIPNGFVNNLPVGMNITGNCYDDINVLNIAAALEDAMPYKGQIAKEVK